MSYFWFSSSSFWLTSEWELKNAAYIWVKESDLDEFMKVIDQFPSLTTLEVKMNVGSKSYKINTMKIKQEN